MMIEHILQIIEIYVTNIKFKYIDIYLNLYYNFIFFIGVIIMSDNTTVSFEEWL